MLYRRWDSNPHASRHQILSLACLPISTHLQPVSFFDGAKI